MVFEEQQVRVAPLTNFPDADIAEASKRLVQNHLTLTATSRVLLQASHLSLILSIDIIMSTVYSAFILIIRVSVHDGVYVVCL